MEITWLGHSAMRLVSSDVVMVTDPFPGLAPMPGVRIVAVTNDGPMHSASSAVGGDPRLIDGPGLYEVLGYNIIGIGTALNDEEASRRINTVYVIRSDGISVCHVGALAAKLSARQLDSLGAVDVLIADPVQNATVGPRGISELVNVLGPRIVVPVGGDGVVDVSESEEPSPLDALLRQMNVERPDPQLRLNVLPTNLPRETTVVRLQRRG